MIIKSKIKYPTEILMVLTGWVGLIIWFFISKPFPQGRHETIEYVQPMSMMLLLVFTIVFFVNKLYKNLEVYHDKLIVKKKIGFPKVIQKEDIEGYWDYHTIGAFGEESSIYILLKSGKKVVFSKKAYQNFPEMRKGIISIGIKDLGSYDYKKTYLRNFNRWIPWAFFISIVLLTIIRILSKMNT